jgi:hypothetical protein
MLLQQLKEVKKYTPVSVTFERQEEFFLVMRLLGGTSTAAARLITGKDFYHSEMYFQMKDNYAAQGLEPMTTKTFDIKVKE